MEQESAGSTAHQFGRPFAHGHPQANCPTTSTPPTNCTQHTTTTQSAGFTLKPLLNHLVKDFELLTALALPQFASGFVRLPGGESYRLTVLRHVVVSDNQTPRAVTARTGRGSLWQEWLREIDMITCHPKLSTMRSKNITLPNESLR
eukprot:1727446-Amphidinium_carterae.1